MVALIALEGLFYGMAPFVIGIVLSLIGKWTSGIIFLLISFFIFLFFRCPDRTAEGNSKFIYAPADGRVICLKREFENCFLMDTAQRVSIFMSIFNVHINYSPVNGVVEYVKYMTGKFIKADIIGLNETNENNFIGISTGDTKIGVRQVAGWVARRIVCDCRQGDKLVAGKRFGLIRFGSRVDLFIPKDYIIRVKSGDVVRAGKTIIGEKK